MKQIINRFCSHNDWLTFRHGKTEVVVEFSGKISHLVTPRGRAIAGNAECREWIASHGLADELSAWISSRADAISSWRHETPHHRFDCDGGGLAVRVNGSCMIRVNCGSDGNHPVYILGDDAEVPPFWTPCGFSLDACTIEPMDYDYDGGKPICKIAVKSAWFYRHENAILVKAEKEG